MTIAPECYERFLKEASSKFFKFVEQKEYKKALKLEKEYSLFKFFSTFCNNISRGDYSAYMYDSLKTIKLINTKVPKVFKNLDSNILTLIRKDLMIDYFFDKKAKKYFENHYNTETGIKYNYETCLLLYKHFVNLKIKLEYNHKETIANFGEDSTVYKIENNSCSFCQECKHLKEFYPYNKLPEIPIVDCKNPKGCNCTYHWH